jgi:hypothetical protein
MVGDSALMVCPSALDPPPRPRLRGVSHQWARFPAIRVGVRIAGAVFAARVVAMFGASALYALRSCA